MKQRKYLYPLVIVLLVVAVGFYAVDSHSKEASIFSLPDISGTNHVTKAAKQPVQSLQQFNDAIVNIADEANPTVVTIKVTQEVKVPENPFFRFFGDQRGGGSHSRERRGIGSGVIVSKDGYILTNNHVVQDAKEITVRLYNDEEYTGKVIGTDPQTDIAVVKIDTDDNLSSITIGDSDKLRVGEMVLALGSPENLAHSVSMGIISAKSRNIGLIQDGKGYENYLQTDAAINPGNSGGALVDMDGKLIGINAAIASQSGGNEGIGFAIPINLAESVMKSLIKNGKVERGYLGIQYGGDVDGTMAKALGLKKSAGIIVGSVEKGGPADKAGVKEGDVIQSINGQTVDGWPSVRSAIGTAKPNSTIKIGIIRDKRERTLDVTLGQRDQEVTASSSDDSNEDMQKSLGFRIQTLSNDIAQQLDVKPGQQGVVVSNVNQGSNAAREGLERGDIITKINKQPIKNVSDFKDAINKLADNKNPVVLLQVLKQGQNLYIAFEL